MYARGSLADYNDWADIVEDDGWNAANLKKYILKHQTLDNIDTAEPKHSLIGEHHGQNGPVRTSFNTEPPSAIEEAFIKSANAVTGLEKPKDPWSGDHIGFYSTMGAVARTGPYKGKRSYAARGYLDLAVGRSNLNILVEACVQRITLLEDSPTASGVEFTHGGKSYDVNAKREVIVSCGAVQTPQVLELSGIGSPDILSAAGVKVRIPNNEVGENFQDHVINGVGYYTAPGVCTGDIMAIPEVMAQTQKQYAQNQDGPMSSIGSTHGFFPYKISVSGEELEKTVKQIEESIIDSTSTFQKKQLAKVMEHLQSSKSANIQVVLLPVRFNPEEGLYDQSKLYGPLEPPQMEGPMHMGVGVMLQYPASRGSVHIRSSNVKDPPVIDPGYITHPADVSTLAGALKLLDKIMHHEQISPMLQGRYFPDSKYDLQDLEQNREVVRNLGLGEYHACGSVAMGAALDSSLLVKGTTNIRVIDASIFPNNVSGNICSSVYTVAERAADIIKEKYSI